MGVFSRITQGLAKTREGLLGAVRQILPGSRRLTPELYEELEGALLAADLGAGAVAALMEAVRESVRQSGETDAASVRAVLKTVITERLRKGLSTGAPHPPAEPGTRPLPHPLVVLFLGINGVGKTTTIGKLAARYRNEGKNVVLVAADTFRAAAGDQLEVWGQRVGAEVVKHQTGADPAAVAFDGLAAARARQADIVLVDTAGRLHTKTNLMDELRKIKRTLEKALPGAPHEVLLVLDATVGQNGLAQARQFHDAVGVTGVVLTKLDGTAKGGIVVAIVGELGLPVRYVGVGESVEDLQAFDPEAFVDALLGEQ
jgi:fused signal recognition particle receptor